MEHYTRLLSTGPCRAKQRHAPPDCHVNSALFWDVMQHRMLIPYWHFRTTNRLHLQRSRNPKEKTEHDWN